MVAVAQDRKGGCPERRSGVELRRRQGSEDGEGAGRRT